MKKKLVIFHPAIAPYRIDFFNSLYDAFEATFYFEFEDALEQSFAQDKLRGRLHFTPRFLSPGLFGIKNLRTEVISILRKESPDIVFCSEYNIMGLLILFYKMLFNRELAIYTICDDSKDIAAKASCVKRIMRSIAIRFYTGIIVANNEVLSWYKNHFKAKHKFLYFPIIQRDQEFRQLLDKALPISKTLAEQYQLHGKKILLFVGRLTAVKNLSFLLRALDYVIDTYPDTVLLLVGEGNDRDTLEQEIKRLHLEKHVIFAGKKQGDELYAHYNLGQIFILPSYYEPFGAVVNEALLAGCYTLCSSAAGAACLIDPKSNGDRFDPVQLSDLTEKLQTALEHCDKIEQVSIKENNMFQSYDQYMISLLGQLESIQKK